MKDETLIKSLRNVLTNKGRIYYFINTTNGNQYIGSAKDFYIRLNEHLNNRKSNIILQKAFNKYGLENFNWIIYEYFSYGTKILSGEDLTKLETSYIKYFDFYTLYNMKREASSMLGYKHTDAAIQKMIQRFKDSTNHPMFGKKHKEETKELMRMKRNKYLDGVGIYDLNNN